MLILFIKQIFAGWERRWSLTARPLACAEKVLRLRLGFRKYRCLCH